MMRLLRPLLLVLLVPQLVSAQVTSDFTIQVFGSTDSIAPTTPALLAVTPISTSQIDLTWSTSTDNYAVFGYVVFRDGTAIATTTALSYSDMGLSASTTYTYEVAAFDGVPNYSSTSAPVATTTPDIFVPPPDPEEENTSVSGTSARTVLSGITLEVGVATATLSVDTRRPSRVEVRIGTTQSYEQMFIVGNTFRTSHEIFINDLTPDTTYYYELLGYTPSGSQTVLERGSFTTLSDQAPLPPTNVSNLAATQVGAGVELAYELPADFPDNGVVRVVRNRFGYPQFISDGQIVYEGTAEQVLDAGAFSNSNQVFYTVFVIDPNGLVSSGAIVALTDNRRPVDPPRPTTPSAESPTKPIDAGAPPTTEEPEPDLVTPAEPAPDLTGFPALRDFRIEQSGLVFSFASSSIGLSSDEPFTVSIPAERVAGDFKTMAATLADPRGNAKTFSFLLRLNGDRSQYNAVIAPLRVGGVSDLTVEIFDYDTKVIGAYDTTLTFAAPTTATTTAEAWYWNVRAWLWGLLLLVPLATLACVWFLFWRRDRDEDNNTI